MDKERMLNGLPKICGRTLGEPLGIHSSTMVISLRKCSLKRENRPQPQNKRRYRRMTSRWWSTQTAADIRANIQPQPLNQDQESFHPSMSNSPVKAMGGIEQDAPLGAGFEDHIHKAPLETKAVIRQTWYSINRALAFAQKRRLKNEI